MSFLYPYAFLILLAIPVLIIIYLLKNKYKESTTPSTYLWELSKKFLKKRSPLHTFEHLIALLLQIATISALAICLAHPVITTPNKTDNVLFILDGSASMNMKDGEETSFDKAKKEINKIAEESKNGSAFSLVYSGKETRVVFQNVTNKNQLSLYVDSLKAENLKNDLGDSLSKAQEVIENNNINLCYLLTDKKVENLTNINLIDCSVEKDNYSLSDLTYSYEDSTLTLNASVLSHLSDKNLTVRFFVNNGEIGTRKYSVKKGEPYAFKIEYKDVKGQYKDISSVKAQIVDEDSLAEDNEMIVYNNSDTAMAKVLLVSDDSFYIKAILSAINNKSDYKNDVTVVSTKNYNPLINYDLYIYDSFTPSSLPKSGSIIFFNSSTTLEGTGFIAQKAVEADEAVHLTYADNTSSLLYNSLTANIAHNDIAVKKYVRYSLTSDFTTILSYDNIPFVFAGKTENQQREVVFSFDLHDSDLPMQYDYSVLMRNAFMYTNPKIMDKYAYEVGDDIKITLSNNLKAISLKTPSGKTETFSITNKDYLTYTLDEIGTYQTNVTYQDGSEKTIGLYSRYPDDERVPHVVDTEKLSLNIDTTVKKGNSIFDNLLPIVICAAIFFLADWGVYAYEQY